MKKYFFVKNNNEVTTEKFEDGRTYAYARRREPDTNIWTCRVFLPGQEVAKRINCDELPDNVVWLTSGGGCVLNKNNQICSTYNAGTRIVKYVMVDEKDNGIIQVQLFQIDVVVNKVFKNYTVKTMFLYSINTKTGQTFYHNPQTLIKDKPIKHETLKQLSPVSEAYQDYVWELVPCEIIDYIIDRILDKKSEMLGFRPTVCKDSFMHNGRCKGMEYIVSVNSNPLCNYMAKVRKYMSLYYYNKYFKNNKEDQITTFLKLCKLPNSKTLRKICREDPKDILWIKSLEMCNIFDLDAIIQMFKRTETKKILKQRFLNYCNFIFYKGELMTKDCYSGTRHTYESIINGTAKTYIEMFLKTHDDKKEVLQKRLLSMTDEYAFSDCIRLLNLIDSKKTHDFLQKFNEKYPEIDLKKQGYKFNSVKSLKKYVKRILSQDFTKEIHDELTVQYSLLNDQHYTIPYSKSERELVCKIDNYEFILPDDTLELKKIGSEMNICVGGYNQKALNKDVTIIATKLGDKYVTCMELSRGEIHQVRGYSNNLIDEKTELGKSIFKWLEINHLTVGSSTVFYGTDFKGPKFKEPKLFEIGEITETSKTLIGSMKLDNFVTIAQARQADDWDIEMAMPFN